MSNSVELGLESVQLRHKVFLILNSASLAFRIVGIDEADGPGKGNPPLVFPAGWVITLKYVYSIYV